EGRAPRPRRQLPRAVNSRIAAPRQDSSGLLVIGVLLLMLIFGGVVFGQRWLQALVPEQTGAVPTVQREPSSAPTEQPVVVPATAEPPTAEPPKPEAPTAEPSSAPTEQPVVVPTRAPATPTRVPATPTSVPPTA